MTSVVLYGDVGRLIGLEVMICSPAAFGRLLLCNKQTNKTLSQLLPIFPTIGVLHALAASPALLRQVARSLRNGSRSRVMSSGDSDETFTDELAWAKENLTHALVSFIKILPNEIPYPAHATCMSCSSRCVRVNESGQRLCGKCVSAPSCSEKKSKMESDPDTGFRILICAMCVGDGASFQPSDDNSTFCGKCLSTRLILLGLRYVMQQGIHYSGSMYGASLIDPKSVMLGEHDNIVKLNEPFAVDLNRYCVSLYRYQGLVAHIFYSIVIEKKPQ
jgi:hypothetical protein